MRICTYAHMYICAKDTSVVYTNHRSWRLHNFIIRWRATDIIYAYKKFRIYLHEIRQDAKMHHSKHFVNGIKRHKEIPCMKLWGGRRHLNYPWDPMKKCHALSIIKTMGSQWLIEWIAMLKACYLQKLNQRVCIVFTLYRFSSRLVLDIG